MLKLNFAHYGDQTLNSGVTKNEWKNKIFELMDKYDNVYADISCRCCEPDFFKGLEEDMDNYKDLKDRILFGSDLPVNLFENCSSYNEYLNVFWSTNLIGAADIV